jgi:hypothetical protein
MSSWPGAQLMIYLLIFLCAHLSTKKVEWPKAMYRSRIKYRYYSCCHWDMKSQMANKAGSEVCK